MTSPGVQLQSPLQTNIPASSSLVGFPDNHLLDSSPTHSAGSPVCLYPNYWTQESHGNNTLCFPRLLLQTLAHVGATRPACPNHVAMATITVSGCSPYPFGLSLLDDTASEPPSLLVKDITQCWAVVQSLIPPPWPPARSAHKDRKMPQRYSVKCGLIIRQELALN